jgi:hypothetical protein
MYTAFAANLLSADHATFMSSGCEIAIGSAVNSAEEIAGRVKVVVLADGETVHNAFFDRRFTP